MIKETSLGHRRGRIAIGALGVVAISTLASSCSNATTGAVSTAGNTAGVTSDKIIVGGLASLSGPLPADFAPIFQGVQAYLDMVNASGGVNGRKIDLAYQLDDGSSPSQDVDQARSLVNQYHVFAVVGVATPSFSGAGYLVQNNVPTFGYAIQPQWSTSKNLFGSTGSWVNFSSPQPQAAFLASQSHAKTAAVLAYNISQSSQACQGIADSMRQFGFKVGFEDLSIPAPATNLNADVSRIAQSGATFVASCMDVTGNITLATTIHQDGLSGITQYWLDGYSQQTLTKFSSLMQGTYFALPNAPFEAATLYPGKYPGLDKFIAQMAKDFPGQPLSQVALQGWINAAQFVAGLQKIGRRVTRTRLIRAINDMTAFTADGIMPPVNWKTNHGPSRGPACQALVQVQGAKFVPVFGSSGSVFTCFAYPYPGVTTPTTIASSTGGPWRVSQLITYALPGIPYGCVFGLLAVGLVLTYKTSGVFNLAYGTQAYCSALVYFVCVQAGWPKWASFMVAVAVLGPALGLALWIGLFSHVQASPTAVKLTISLGVLVALPEIAQAFFGNGVRLGPPSLFWNQSTVYFRFDGFAVNGNELSTVVVSFGVLAGLLAIMRLSRLGLQMRAVVESPKLAELSGVRSNRVGAGAWMLSSFVAGLAGVLLAPLFAELNYLDFTTLLVSAIAAAALGGLVSLPWALGGGLLLGIGQQILGGYLPPGTVIAGGLRPGFPFVVLAVLVLTLPSLRHAEISNDPLADVEPPLAIALQPLTALPSREATRRSTRGGPTPVWLAIAAFTVISCLTWVPDQWVFYLSQAAAYSIIFLSITVLTGMLGQVSLAQAAFAGIGAFTAGHMASSLGLSVLVGAVLGALLAAIIGAAVALPAVKLGTISLAMLTLSMSLLADNVVFPYSWAGNGSTGISIPRPVIASINFSTTKPFFVLLVVVLAGASTVVLLIKRGYIGRYMTAISGSEWASAAIGIDTTRIKVVAFALASALAGLGGALYGSLQGSVSSSDFNYFYSLVFLVVVVVVGSRTIAGAIGAGVAYVLIAQGLGNLPPELARLSSFEPVIFGVAAITFVLHPEGIVDLVTCRLSRLRATLPHHHAGLNT